MDFEQVIENLRRKGSLLGYKDEELDKFVQTEYKERERLERERLEREERAAAREEKKRAEEADKELKRIEAEKEIKRIEAEAKQKELDHALELKRLEINSRRHSSGSTHSNDDHSRVEHYSPRINMVPFDEQKDRIDTYLATFEKIVKANNIPVEHWTVNLSGLLQGGAKEEYNRLSDRESENFETVKAALLKRYRLTADAYRRKFKQVSKLNSETHAQYIRRVTDLFQRWMELAEVPQTYNGIRDEIVKDVILSSYRQELVIFLAERGTSSLEEISRAADRYDEAHSRFTHTHTRTNNVRVNSRNRRINIRKMVAVMVKVVTKQLNRKPKLTLIHAKTRKN